MRISDLAYETVSALEANRARSLLTVLGVVIGIAAVIAMVALIGGLKQSLVGELGLAQARMISINYHGNSIVRLSDVEAMEQELDGYFECIVPQMFGSADVTSGTEKGNGNCVGTTPDYERVAGVKMVQGRFFNQDEASSGEQVVVLDQAGVRLLFGSPDVQAVGKSVRIGSAEFTIVGVRESSAGSGNSKTVNVLLPSSTCSRRITGSTEVSSMMGLAREDVDINAAKDQAQDWLVKRFRIPEADQEDSLYLYTAQSIIDQVNTMMASFQVLMTAVASISLLVGGIGIMNMMLTNVTERIREIGLRKALGAKRRDITRQFLLESVCLTLSGGIIGTVLGYLGAFALSGMASSLIGEGSKVVPTIDMGTMLLVTAICVSIGIIFGYYPARRAARLDPVESLRYQ